MSLLKKDIATIKLFSFYEKLQFVITVLIRKVTKRYRPFEQLLHEKYSFDLLEKKGYFLKKLDSKVFQIKYTDKLLGELAICIRRNTSDLAVFEQVIERKDYDKLVQAFNENFDIKNGLFIVDAGANIGLFSVYINRHFKDATIHAIEPSMGNYEILEKNIKANKCENVITYIRALWHSNESLELDNSFRDGKHWSITAKPAENGGIKGITLSDLLSLSGRESIDILKIDIEGAEFKLFGDDATLKVITTNVKIMAIEIHEDVGEKDFIINILSQLGFVFFETGEFVIAYNKRRFL